VVVVGAAVDELVGPVVAGPSVVAVVVSLAPVLGDGPPPQPIAAVNSTSALRIPG
jgi:hypothetical protein